MAPDATTLALSLLEAMADQKADFTLTFRNLAQAVGEAFEAVAVVDVEHGA